MGAPEEGPARHYLLARADFQSLFDALAREGYTTLGPTVRDAAIVYAEIRNVEDLPIGWTDRQGPGTYRIERRKDDALFGYNVGPHSWKGYLYPSRERLWAAHWSPSGFTVEPPDAAPPRYAFLGVRACELQAIAIQDRVFDGPYADPAYRARRASSLRIAVQCGQAGPTCFCASMGAGPRVGPDHDLALTELLGPGSHRFLLQVGSPRGAAIADRLPLRPATEEDLRARDALVDRATSSMGRSVRTDDVHDLLLGNPGLHRWEEVARRCLACTNCTLACPTCFCSTTEEVPDLSGDRVEHWRRWDSCFTLAFTQLGKGSVRRSPTSRYRQWLTHKLASWQDQFGSSGCVGCGRCITWCPVGIDLTEEVAALREESSAKTAVSGGER